LTDEENQSLAQSGTTNPDAYQAYQRAKYLYNYSTYENAIRYAKTATELDPNYQEAYFLLADQLFGGARTGALSKDSYAEARKYLEKLIEVNDSTALAHWTNAEILWKYDQKWIEADREYKRAESLDPTYETPLGFLDWMGRSKEALIQLERQIESIDPFDMIQLLTTGYSLLFHREFERTIEQANNVLILEPKDNNAFIILALAY